MADQKRERGSNGVDQNPNKSEFGVSEPILFEKQKRKREEKYITK
jgi:hypothetical protein